MAQANVYVRTADGVTEHMSPAEGIANFLSEDGYRLTIYLDGFEVVLRKNCAKDEDVTRLDEALNQNSVEALITIKDLR